MDKNYYLNQNIGSNGIAPVYNPARLNGPKLHELRDTPLGVNVGQHFNTNTASSQYLPELGDINAAVNYQGFTSEDLLADKQSGWDMAANALINNGVIAGTTMVSSTLGIVDGLLEAMMSGDTSKIWNNTINNAMVDAQEAAKEIAPIYRGKQYEDASIWDKMGTGIFWADLVENLGFTEGMLLPGIGAGAALQALGLGKTATMLGSALYSSMGEGSIEAINEKNDEIRNKTALANQVYSEKANQITNSEDWNALNEDYINTLNNIEEDANNAGNFTLGANMALLTLTNTIEFGNLFTRGFSTSRRIAGQLMREGNKYIADSGKKAIAKAAGEKLIDAFSEGMEEVSQSAISNTGQYYSDYNKFNESQFNPEKRELVSSLISAFGESYANTLQDKQTAEEFAAGFLTGLIGVPQLRKAALPVTMENNIVGDLYAAYKQNKREQDLANTINQRLADDKQFNAYYNGLVRHLAIQEDMNQAIDNADQTAFENAKSAQLVSDIFMFEEAGHLDHLKELVNNSVDLSDEGIQSIIDETSKNGNGPFMSNGNKMSVGEVRELIQKRQKTINDKIDSLAKHKENTEAKYPSLNENGVKNVVFLLSQLDDYENRLKELNEKKLAGINELIQSYPTNSEGKRIIKVNDKEYTLQNEYTKENLPNEVTFFKALEKILNSTESTLSADKRRDIAVTIGDANKLDANIKNINMALMESLLNPNKANSAAETAAEKIGKEQDKKQKKELRESIEEAKVSDIVKGIEDNTLGIDDLDDLFGKGDISKDMDEAFAADEAKKGGKEKVQEAKNIVETSNRLHRTIDTLGHDKSPDEVAAAHKLLDNSKDKAESVDELLDMSSEAYNDLRTIHDDAVLESRGISKEDLSGVDEALQDLKTKSQDLIGQAIDILNNEDQALSRFPKKEDLESGKNVVRQFHPTGHDSMISPESETDRMRREAPKTEDTPTSKDDSDRIPTPIASTIEGKDTNDTLASPEVRTSPASIDNQEGAPEVVNNVYQFWKPTTTHFPFGRAYTKGDNTPFYKKAASLGYTPKQLNRIQKIGEFLERHGTFTLVESGGVPVGTTVRFTTDETLNQDVGEVVILMIDAQGRVIGDIMSKNDPNVSKQVGLRDFIEAFEAEYNAYKKDAENTEPFVSAMVSRVSKNMVGKAPYTSVTNFNEMPTLNEISGGKVQLAIAVTSGSNATMVATAGNTKKQGQDDFEMSIITPLDAVAGQPYLLLKTSSKYRAYMPIPFLMPTYNSNNNARLTNIINNLLEEKIPTCKTKEQFAALRDAIKDLLAIHDIFFKLDEKENTIQVFLGRKDGATGKTNWQSIYAGSVTNCAQNLKEGFTRLGIPYQVSRKYVNDSFNGESYNALIGELGRTNLPVDTAHTINDWFVIDPIDKDGKSIKARAPKTTGINPNAAPNTSVVSVVGKNGEVYIVDFDKGTVTDKEGKSYGGERTNLFLAKTWGETHSLDMTKPYQTKWGMYDPTQNAFVVTTIRRFEDSNPREGAASSTELDAEEAKEFIEKGSLSDEEKQGILSLGTTNKVSTPVLDDEVLTKEAKKLGLLKGPKKVATWEALTTTEKQALLNIKSKLVRSTKYEALVAAFDGTHINTDKLGKPSVEEFINGTPLYRKTDGSTRVWDKEKEVSWLSKVLPGLATEDVLKVIDGLIKVSNSIKPEYAYGQFLNGIITISNKAARGTLYHEAFHSVVNTLLNSEEHHTLFKAAVNKYGNLDVITLEERLAEDFRRYVQLEETPIIGSVVKIFRYLKHLLQNLLGKEPYINKVFYDINSGNFADRTTTTTAHNTGIKYSMALGFMGTVSEFQEIVDGYINNAGLRLNRYNMNRIWGNLVDDWRREGYEIKGYYRKGKYIVTSAEKISRYRRMELTKDEEIFKNDVSKFLSNFGIKLKDISDYEGEIPLFDALNKVINYTSAEDLSEETGYAIAFMMQYNPVTEHILKEYIAHNNNLKGLKRAFKTGSINKGQLKVSMRDLSSGRKQELLKEIGKDIASELRKLYGIDEGNPSFMDRIWKLISEFFNNLTPATKAKFHVLQTYAANVANCVKLNDKSIILSDMIKPGSTTKAERVDIAKALRENPYEESIISTLSKYNIGLAGSASMAAVGTVYRPKENPLHDIDFNAAIYNQEKIKSIIDKEYPNNTHIRTITNSPTQQTETYLIMDRPFTIRRISEAPTISINELLDSEGNKIGTLTGSDLILNEGVHGKLLDFFIGEGNIKYGTTPVRLNNKDYILSDYRNALEAKVDWVRLKDIWDYNRFILNPDIVTTPDIYEGNAVVSEKIAKSNIIWGHPAIGKTTYVEQHRNEILEWDEEVNAKRNAFLNKKVDPTGTLSAEERAELKHEYMVNFEKYPDYVAFISEEWSKLKERARKEHKKIFASMHPLLKLFANDFDLIINLTNAEFVSRNIQRGGTYYNSLDWKHALNETLAKVQADKQVLVDAYFSDMMEDTKKAEARIAQHHRDKLMYANLSVEDKQYLKERGISIEEYNDMTQLEQEVLFECKS